MKLVVTIKNVYGNDMIYPANEAATIVCQLVGKKTLNRTDLSNMVKLGHTVELIQGATL